MKAVLGISAAGVALSLVATPASAQLHGFAVEYAPVPVGVTISGSFHRVLESAPLNFNSAGGMIIIGLPSFQVGAGVGVFDLSDTKDITFGGHGAFHLPLPPTTPVSVSIVAGVGVISEEFSPGNSVTTINVPAGAVLSIDVPSPAVDITPWISPQFRWVRVGEIIAGTGSVSNSDFGVSGGLMISLPVGFGFHVVGDWDNASEIFTVGGGVHFTIKVPSLNPMGM